MALTVDQDAYFRARLGSGYDDSDAEERLIRLGGEGYEPAVVVEVLQERLSTLATKPDSYTVVGEYSETWGKTLELVQSQLGAAREEAANAGLDVPQFTVLIQQSERFDYVRTALDTEEYLARGGRSRLPGGR